MSTKMAPTPTPGYLARVEVTYEYVVVPALACKWAFDWQHPDGNAEISEKVLAATVKRGFRWVREVTLADGSVWALFERETEVVHPGGG